ncbi:VOC family protein [Rhodococcus oxybenzonivorans]|uniref:VOC family protein n=1 Tax=Rhodococcus oxybenzonivorans TaxID=1990687 RepID=UPI0029540D49|nr:VOC family protein [Rhodococcus oxybenzonivorans]MDV7356325.1 VOC family protein [Rhodococcus oxybenzonivorans]
MTIPTFAAIELVVHDLAASLAFYRRIGLDIPAGSEEAPHVEFELPGGIRLLWDTVETVRSFEPDWTTPQGGHRVALGFDCGSPDVVDKVFTDLTDAGYRERHAPWDAPWGQRYATIDDPDGNPVDLFAPLTTT